MPMARSCLKSASRSAACTWCCRDMLRFASATASAMSPRSSNRVMANSSPKSGSLSGHVSLVDARAEGEVEALVISPEGLRRLLIAEAELGERIMRALILRRVSLIESGVGGVVIISSSFSGDVARIQSFLTRNAVPQHLLDPETDAEARS